MIQTRYQQHGMASLMQLFGTATWFQLDASERLEACQEVENRLAAERGTPARQVVLRPMEGTCFGVQRGEYIEINQSLLEDGELHARRDGVEYILACPASNWQVLDTLYHEDTHGKQWDQGTAQTWRSYIDSGMDFELYRIQRDEREAFQTGQERTLVSIELVEQLEQKPDANRLDYEEVIRNNPYEEALAVAQERYGDPQIEDTLEQVIADRERGYMPENASESYRHISEVYVHQQLVAAKEEPEMDWAPADQEEESVVSSGGQQNHGIGYGMG